MLNLDDELKLVSEEHPSCHPPSAIKNKKFKNGGLITREQGPVGSGSERERLDRGCDGSDRKHKTKQTYNDGRHYFPVGFLGFQSFVLRQICNLRIN